jgi:hypothetical protein
MVYYLELGRMCYTGLAAVERFEMDMDGQRVVAVRIGPYIVGLDCCIAVLGVVSGKVGGTEESVLEPTVQGPKECFDRAVGTAVLLVALGQASEALEDFLVGWLAV